MGRFGKGLAGESAVSLGIHAASATLLAAELGNEKPTLSVMGQVLQAGCGQNPARQVALGAGMDPSSVAYTVNMVCGSGLKAIHLASLALREGSHDLALAGGMESMSNTPYYARKARWGLTYGDAPLVDGMLTDGLVDAYSGKHMGLSAEWVAETYGVQREEMDRYSVESHSRALSSENDLSEEIIPIKTRRGEVERDENPRRTDLSTLGKLRPVFKKEGVVTAGNASALNDGAATLLLASQSWVDAHNVTPLGWLHESVDGGVPPHEVLMSPLSVFFNLKRLSGLSPVDFDLLEINEAFAVQMVALINQLDLDAHKVNPQGGAVALGHPIGCSGARLPLSALYQLKNKGGGAAFVTLCLGGGGGTGMVIRTSP